MRKNVKDFWSLVQPESSGFVLKRNVKNLKVKTLLLFVIPLVFFVLAAVSLINDHSRYLNKLSYLSSVTQETMQLSNLLHELQKERGMSVIYLASNGRKFTEQLHVQQKKTDLLLKRLDNTVIKDRTGIIIINVLQAMSSNLTVLRQRIATFKISSSVALKTYNQQNAKLLKVISKMVKSSMGIELSQQLVAYFSFLQEKELIGVERAVLGKTFTQDRFQFYDYEYFIKLRAQQALYYKEFKVWSSNELIAKLEKVKNSEAYQKTQYYRNIARTLARNGKFAVDSSLWYEAITANINQLKMMESQITKELVAESESRKIIAIQEIFWWIMSLLLITLVTIFAGLKLVSNINISYFKRLDEYRLLLENCATGMLVVDIKSRDILFCNSHFSLMTGYSAQQVALLSLLEIFYKNDQVKTLRLFQNMADGSCSHVEKIRLQKSNTDTIYVELTSFNISIEGKSYLVIQAHDIGEKLQAQAQFQKSKEALQTILDSVECAVSVVDFDSEEIIYLNDKAEHIYRSKEQAEPLWPLLYPVARNREVQFDKTGEMHEYTEHVYNKTRKCWYQLTNKYIDWHDSRQVSLRLLVDITERYLTENKNQNLLLEMRKLSLRNYCLQESERKHLAANLHDQLGQSMTAVMLQAEFIHYQLESAQPELAESAQNIISTVQSLMGAVREVTNQLRPILLDQLGLVEALRDLVQQWQQINPQTTFVFDAQAFNKRLPDLVGISVYRIVQESLTNACKHAQAGKVAISLKLEGEGATSCMRLKISDDGKGFDSEETHFNGMGLINMRERVEALDGEFRLLTRAGQGVETLVRIPLYEVLAG